MDNRGRVSVAEPTVRGMHLRCDPSTFEATATSLAADSESLRAVASVVRGASVGPTDPAALAREVDGLLADLVTCLGLLATTAGVLASGVGTAARAYVGADERARLELRSLHGTAR